MQRRDFVKLGSVLAAAPYGAFVAHAQNDLAPSVDFLNDGLLLSPKEYAALLMKLADEGKVKPDFYSNGGVVEELEHKFAQLLGKESSVFMPTGTLANHMAIRRLTGNNQRVIVQEQSHIYNDTGDAAQVLSGLNLIPLGLNSVGFSIAEVEQVLAKTKGGRVEAHIGAMSIETPVRRQQDRIIPFDKLQAMTDFAKTNDIKTHLDGARLFVQSVHENVEPKRYGALFDTVFTSMWKCFNASSGAILAGDKAFTEKLFHERRMFGGGLPASWAFAAVALHYADGFIDEYKTAWANAEKFFASIEESEKCKIVKLENGSHNVQLDVLGTNLTKFKESLAKRSVQLTNPNATGFMLKVNPSINRIKPANLADSFVESMKEAAV
ncbi:low specificity L-threonine aldolase [Dyadobacter sp. CY326]|uniref:threonine aldolase family protein n=1 Tax=Dyadobacter sp. CY326 TaxID=2907300 RepID=UPI001F3DB93C|nr:beta-eliminating lyase-related protein [Dyadobacter sp. CY326]MCE7066104.1 threonine aldolase family protein [Dyadobacter sp. CY326]